MEIREIRSWLPNLVKDYLLPLLIAAVPFYPNIRDAFSEPKLHYVYQSTYEKNPLIELNRQMEKFLKQLEAISSGGQSANPPNMLLRAIGKEIYRSLPVMASGIGFKPFDKMTVRIANLSPFDLKNIRVHFTGCADFDSYSTYPDALGSIENKNLDSKHPTGRITIRYDKIPRSPERTRSLAYITYYGGDASQCKPVVEVETDKGITGIGKETIIDSFVAEEAWQRYEYEQHKDLLFKLFLFAAILYLFFQLQSVKRAIRR